MQFSEEYIEICRKLPPRDPYDFQRGDFIEVGGAIKLVIRKENVDLGRGDAILLNCDTEEEFIFEEGQWDSGNTADPVELTWLPHRESDWMKMKDGWSPSMTLMVYGENREKWEVFNHGLKKEIIDDCDDPLLACARAWEKTQEEQHAILP